MNTHQKRYNQRKKVFLAALFFAGSTTLLATVTATKGAMNVASLIAQEEDGIVSETAMEQPNVSPEERTQRFEDIVSRTRDQYATLKQMIAVDIERDLTASLHAGAPEEDKAKVLRHERWDREGSFWMYGIEEIARWFGLQW